jgi:O-antigen/teichoic acid export membrane protein
MNAMNNSNGSIGLSFPTTRVRRFERVGNLLLTLRTGKLLHNAAWNLSGSIIPMIAFIIVLPIMLAKIGVERFGVLSLILALVGYFSVLDFGLARALTKVVAEKQAAGERHQQCQIVWTSLAILSVLGLAAFLIVMPLSQLITIRLLRVSPALQRETTLALCIAAGMMPLVLCASALRGFLEGHQAFKHLSYVRTITGLTTCLAPLLAILYSATLTAILITLVVARSVTCVLYAHAALKLLPELRTVRNISLRFVRQLFGFGAWMTVSNVVSPAMVYLDRFAITTIVSISEVTFYVTPFEAITKLLYVPGAFSSVLFPKFSSLTHAADSRALASHYRNGLATVTAVLAPLVAIAVLGAGPILRVWLGTDFSIRSAPVLRVLAIGMLVNGIASVPFAFLQGIGRPDLTAKSHLFQLMPYVILCCVATSRFGIVGTASSWLVRATVDFLILLVLVQKQLSVRRRSEEAQ